ncbi:MAG: DEAD/DEAH box helicase [Rhodoferax sp.]|uniref:DEAD/DEAH box helicase n=1 Tax=Rhodoferax sp. TaxID=50421 RepID=UPI002632AD51|nr:DEAD/DEAH box helicase [Rhodoferax sp.]MDD2880913.1 DEAD/DEAH box helicase [Rhodoferax sp.]
MTDATLAAGEISSAENFSTDINLLPHDGIDAIDATEAAAPVAEDIPNGFVTLGLAPELIQAVKDLGFTQPTTVQLKTIPLAMQGVATEGKAAKFVDLMVSSQTGSGKTAAFLLPVLHTLLKQQEQVEIDARVEYENAVAEAAAKGEAPPKRAKRKDPTNPRHFSAPTPGALIVCPTRELAQQVAHDAIDLVQHCRGLRVANIVGGMPYQLQIAKLQNANLVVATPGRLLDLQRSMQIKLDQVQFLVVDEADRMLDLGFSDDLAEINQLTIDRKQTMMFSATFAPRIQQLASRVMREPQRITIDSPQEKHANIKQVLFWADNAQHKRKLLDHWLRDTTINQAIVFASTQIECDGLANDLQQEGFDAVALHGALSQGLRNRRLMALRQGQVQILVATDVAARGIDVPTVTHVFNYGLPMKAEDYTHRIGRTGRAGRDGLAVTFAELRDRRRIFDIEAFNRQPIKAEVVPGLEPKQRIPESRPSFGGRDNRGGGDFQSRDRKFGGGGRPGGFDAPRGNFDAPRGNFGDRNSAGPRVVGAGSYQNNSGGGFAGREDRSFAPRESAPREGFSYERKGGFNDRFAGDRNGGGGAAAPRGDFAPRGDSAPRGDFAARKPAFGKPAFAKPAGGGKVFVPRDAQKRFSKNDR